MTDRQTHTHTDRQTHRQTEWKGEKHNTFFQRYNNSSAAVVAAIVVVAAGASNKLKTIDVEGGSIRGDAIIMKCVYFTRCLEKKKI